MSKVRINKFDNMKGLAIILVLIGHFDYINAIPGDIAHYLFLIHLPVFFFVAGYFSKTDPSQPLKSFKRLMVPYIIFCILIELFRYVYTGSMNWNMIVLQSSMALWFLIALFIMKLILPIWDKFRFPIITALAVALIFGIYDIHPNILGLTRMFAYLPVFLVGFYYNSYKDKIKSVYPKLYNFYDRYFIVIAALIVIISIIITIKHPAWDFVFKKHYAYNNILKLAAKRLIVLCCEIGLVIVLNRIMTNKECFLTKFGRNSMSVYVLHPFIYYFFKPIWPGIFTNPTISLISTLALGLIVTVVLSRDVVTKYLNKFTDGVYNLIVKPSP